MTADVILSELRQGERTTSELMEAAGVTRNAVILALGGLNRSGYTIANVAAGALCEAPGRLFDFSKGRGGHAEARWRLVYDREHPKVRVCAWQGCPTRLSHTNPGPYCRHHKGAVARMFLACLDAVLDHEVVTDDAEQLSLV